MKKDNVGPPAEDRQPEFSGPIGPLSEAERHRLARRLLLRGVLLAPAIVASVLTTKAVAASKLPNLTLPQTL
jgi:hypothetical protein